MTIDTEIDRVGSLLVSLIVDGTATVYRASPATGSFVIALPKACIELQAHFLSGSVGNSVGMITASVNGILLSWSPASFTQFDRLLEILAHAPADFAALAKEKRRIMSRLHDVVILLSD